MKGLQLKGASSIYVVRRSPKSRRKEENQLICDSAKGAGEGFQKADFFADVIYGSLKVTTRDSFRPFSSFQVLSEKSRESECILRQFHDCHLPASYEKECVCPCRVLTTFLWGKLLTSYWLPITWLKIAGCKKGATTKLDGMSRLNWVNLSQVMTQVRFSDWFTNKWVKISWVFLSQLKFYMT